MTVRYINAAERAAIAARYGIDPDRVPNKAATFEPWVQVLDESVDSREGLARYYRIKERVRKFERAAKVRNANTPHT